MGQVGDRCVLRGSLPWSDRRFAGVLVVLAVAPAVVRYVRVRLGGAPHHDVQGVWRPLASAVFDGTPLYLGTAVDNKPPLFELLNLAVYASGAYLAVFLALVAAANGAIAVLLWRLFADRRHEVLGAAAAVVFLVSAPLVNGAAVNVRSFSVVLLLWALVRSGPAERGCAVAAACLVSQYAAFGLPVVVYDGLRGQSRVGYRTWVRRFCGAFGATVGATFGVVYLLWGWPSVVAGVRWSVGFAPTYALAWGPSVLTNTGRWLGVIVDGHLRLFPVLCCAVVGLVIAAGSLESRSSRSLAIVSLASTVLLSLPLLVRPIFTYWLYPLPWISTLAVVGADALRQRTGVGT